LRQQTACKSAKFLRSSILDTLTDVFYCIVFLLATERCVAGSVLPASYVWSGFDLRHEVEWRYGGDAPDIYRHLTIYSFAHNTEFMLVLRTVM